MRHMPAVATAATMIVLSATQAAAQQTKSVRGEVSATAPAAVTLQVGSNEMTFNVDSATLVTTRGGSAAMQQARENGRTGVPYTDLVKIGQSVEVAYHEPGMHAATIRVVADGPGQSKTAAAPRAATTRPVDAVGVVTEVSDTLLTIENGSGQVSYVIDGNTSLSGRGLGTQARAMKSAGERTVFSRFVNKGDTVRVRYDLTDGTRYASEVRVTRKRT